MSEECLYVRTDFPGGTICIIAIYFDIKIGAQINIILFLLILLFLLLLYYHLYIFIVYINSVITSTIFMILFTL